MKITCIIASYNRPNWVCQAIRSISQQTHKDYQLIVVDDSTIFDISEVILGFKLSEVEVIHFDVSSEERRKQNRLSININAGLARATGELMCYLGDDDFYYPEWFANASGFFKTHPSIHAAFGKLRYTRSRNMEYPKTGEVRFFSSPIQDPYCRLDHNQIMHRKLTPKILWNEELRSLSAPDGIFMRAVSKKHVFHPIHALAAVKRIHGKNLQQSVSAYHAGKLEGPRE